jgi:hypothetical protein
MGLTEAIIGHLVGDFLLQNDWMAANKKKNSWVCLLHCLIWTAWVCCLAGWWHAWWAPVVLCLTHFLQDRTTFVPWWMKNVSGQAGFASGPLSPWSIIVVDNVMHILTIYLVACGLSK